MTSIHIAFFSALFGAMVQEIIHWYNIRTKLELVKYQKLLKSKGYWIVTALVLIVSAVGPVLWKFDSLSSYTPADFIILGAAFPLIFKKAVAGINAAGETRNLGDETDVRVLKEYFG